ncbi:hypothetical protein ZEAMMB73_Zm00001d041436 [Zea mays]|uniref:Uncharacterized protein n=1 Tax=Zea mays TaxID=4577 RepID=A0A1D6MW20_MAIZE|nr:hypothetical protein ZEAMMB73_Zm00001d041436 [Zea mays]
MEALQFLVLWLRMLLTLMYKHEQYNAFDVVMLLFYFHPSRLMQIGWLLLFTKVLIMVVCLLSSFSSIYQSSNYGCVPSFNIFM